MVRLWLLLTQDHTHAYGVLPGMFVVRQGMWQDLIVSACPFTVAIPPVVQNDAASWVAGDAVLQSCRE